MTLAPENTAKHNTFLITNMLCLPVSPLLSSRVAGSSRKIEAHVYSLLLSVQTKVTGRLLYVFSAVSQISLFGNLYKTVHAIHKLAD